MDYEKKYNNVVNKFAYLLESTDLIKGELRQDIESIFPELKESEDERIRKRLIYYFTNFHLQTFAGIDPKKILSWLEKQGEQKPADKVEPKFKVGDIIRHKKQGFTCKIIAVDTEYRLSGCNGSHLPFDSQDYYELVEQKPAWSKEDKSMMESILSKLYSDENVNSDEYYKYHHWFKSIKDKVSCEANCTTIKEWSKEDEKLINSVIELIDNGALDRDEKNYFIEKLKSLKERYTWKPSDEQVEVLDKVISNPYLSTAEYNGLVALKEQFKAL